MFGAAIEVLRELDPDLVELNYEACLDYELADRVDL